MRRVAIRKLGDMNIPNRSVHPAPLTLFTAIRESARLRHYSLRTEKTYIGWGPRHRRLCTTAVIPAHWAPMKLPRSSRIWPLT